MRRVVGILGICVTVSVAWGTLLAETPEKPSEAKSEFSAPETNPSTPQVAEEIRQRLHEPISIKLDKVPLEDALVEILRKHGFEYWLDADAIQEESLRLVTVEVTCDLKNVSIRAALKRILGPARLCWVCEDTGIRITTQARQSSLLFARIYDVGELLETADVEVTVPAIPHQQAQFSAPVPSSAPADKTEPEPGMHGHNYYQLPPATDHADRTPENALILMIQSALGGAPDAPWMEADGEGGTVHLIRTRHAKLLVIRQHESCHAEIEDLLNELISHQHPGMEEEESGTPPAKNASRNVVRPRVRIVAGKAGRPNTLRK